MGITSASRGTLQWVRRSGCADSNDTGASHLMDDGPKVVAGTFMVTGRDSSEADEKMIRASLVADEWDGSNSWLSRLV